MSVHGERQCWAVALRPPPPACGRERIHRLWARLRNRRLGEPYECGQLHGHGGECTWFTPGGYLPPPLITELDWFDASWRARRLPWWVQLCPACKARVDQVDSEASLVIYCDADSAERDEIRWTFSPCGCEGREIVENDATPGSD